MLRRVLSRAPLPASPVVYPISQLPPPPSRRSRGAAAESAAESACRVTFFTPAQLTAGHCASGSTDTPPPPWFRAAAGEVEWVPQPHAAGYSTIDMVAGLGRTASVRDYRLAITQAIWRVQKARAAWGCHSHSRSGNPRTTNRRRRTGNRGGTRAPSNTDHVASGVSCEEPPPPPPPPPTGAMSAYRSPTTLLLTPPTAGGVVTQHDLFHPARPLTASELAERTACFAVTAAYRYHRLKTPHHPPPFLSGRDGGDSDMCAAAAAAAETQRRRGGGGGGNGHGHGGATATRPSRGTGGGTNCATPRRPDHDGHGTDEDSAHDIRLVVDSPEVQSVLTGAVIGRCVNDARSLGNLRHDEGTPEFYAAWVCAAIPSRAAAGPGRRVFMGHRDGGGDTTTATTTAAAAANSSPAPRRPRHGGSFASSGSSGGGAVWHHILRGEAIRRAGMNLLYAVGQGAATEPHVILHEYLGDPSSPHSVALLGKGVTFDSGGLNLKAYGSMETMHTDMMGAATVWGALRAAVTLQLPVNIVAAVGLVENAIGPASLHPSSILTSLRGSTVEVVNTDAEGRLVLADLLTFVQRHARLRRAPRTIIDVATLTGAVVASLGTRRAGVFGRSSCLTEQLMQCGVGCGEELWPLPVGEEHVEMMRSGAADWRNAGVGRNAGACSAAAFLSHFVDGGQEEEEEKEEAKRGGRAVQWAHLDIAGTAYNGDAAKGFYPAGVTGFGVQLLVDYLRLPQGSGGTMR